MGKFKTSIRFFLIYSYIACIVVNFVVLCCFFVLKDNNIAMLDVYTSGEKLGCVNYLLIVVLEFIPGLWQWVIITCSSAH